MQNSQDFQILIEVTRFTTLYLLKNQSPSTFLFEDPIGNQHLVKLGEKIECSCHRGNLGHCIHSLYALQRIYKLPQHHQLLNQTSYSQQDISTMVQFSKFSEKQQNRILRQEELKQIRKKNELNQILSKEWPKFQPATLCSICYDNIENQTAIISCQDCVNYFHTKCLTVWAQQRQNEELEASCPMCRSELGSNQKIRQRVKLEQRFFVQYHLSHGVDCNQCGKEVLKKIFKCLLCEKFLICSDCYYSWKHQNHDKFIGKMSKRGNWQVCSRSQFNMSKLKASSEYIKQMGVKGNESDFKNLMGPKYEQFIKEKVKQATMLDHLLSCFLDVEKQVHKTYKKIDFEEQQIQCCMCRRKNIVGMRRLPCKHFIDEKCLKFVLKGSFLQCPLDKNNILPGLNGEVLDIK